MSAKVAMQRNADQRQHFAKRSEMYRTGAANGQYRQMSAEGCIIINETEADLTPADVDQMIKDAETAMAMIGAEIVVQFGDDSSKQETYTERALRASLRKLMKY